MSIAELMNLLLPIYALMFAAIIGFLLFKKSRNRGKVPCLILENKGYYVEYVKPENSTVKPSGATRATKFGTDDFHRELKPFYKFWRLAKEVLILGLNAEEPLNSTLSNAKMMFKGMWTTKEVQHYVAKMVAKARVKGQMISNMWGILILVSVMIVGFVVYMGFSRIGAF